MFKSFLVEAKSNKKINKIAKDALEVLDQLQGEWDPGDKEYKDYDNRITSFKTAISNQCFTFDQVQWLMESDLI